VLLALCLGAAARPAAATSDFLEGVVSDSGGAGVGPIVRADRSLYRGAGVRFDLLPAYIYEGELLYLHADRVGVKLDFGPRAHFSAFLSRRLESFPVERFPSDLQGMSRREPETDLGLSFEQRSSWGNLFGEALRDASGTSGGSELRLGYSMPIHAGNLILAPYFSLALRDAELNDYYYGVLPSEATADRPSYFPGRGLNASVGLNMRYDLALRWHLLAGVSATEWSSGVRRSPIVENRPQVSAFTGFAYEFVPTPPREDDHDPLIFKVLYGRATSCNLLPVMEVRCRSIDTPDRTGVFAVEVGRPIVEEPHDWHVMVAWYAGLLRHEERGFQNDSWQLDVYLKAFYWGFPWSDHVRTRIGFGGGLSFAQAVPYVERRDQDARGRNTSKLLQYLDPTIDVSIGDLIGDRTLRETYFGLGVSHRSGIFGASQLYSNVNGGSNYIYAYIEWRI
jgi:outer membrane protein